MKPHTTKLFISAITAGIITGGGSLLTALANGGALTPTGEVVAVVMGLLSAAKDLRAYSSLPPIKGE